MPNSASAGLEGLAAEVDTLIAELEGAAARARRLRELLREGAAAPLLTMELAEEIGRFGAGTMVALSAPMHRMFGWMERLAGRKLEPAPPTGPVN